MGGTLTLLIDLPTEAEQLVIRRVTPRQQTVDLENGNRIAAQILEQMANKAVMMIQEIDTQSISADDYQNIRIDINNVLTGIRNNLDQHLQQLVQQVEDGLLSIDEAKQQLSNLLQEGIDYMKNELSNMWNAIKVLTPEGLENIGQLLQDEIQARINGDQQLQDGLDNLQNEFSAWIGRGGFLDAYDFGRVLHSTDPIDQQALTDYALSQISSISDPLQIWNSTKITNLFNNHTFNLTNTQDTDPPIFEWTDQGIMMFKLDTVPTESSDNLVKSGGIFSWFLNLPDRISKMMFLYAHPVGSLYETVAEDEGFFQGDDPLNVPSMAIKYPGSTWEVWGAGRVTVSLDLNDPLFDTVGKMGGAAAHLLTAAESGMPAHNHSQNPHTHLNMAGQVALQPGSYSITFLANSSPPNYNGNEHTTATNNAVAAQDASQAHNNLQPYKIAYKYKRTA